MIIRTKRINPEAIMPTRGSRQAAGYDLYSPLEVFVPPHQTIKVGIGFAMEIPEGYFGGIFARSGLSARSGLRPANCVGVIDSDYRGEIIVAVHNDSEHERRIEAGERIAQLIVMPYLAVEFEEADELSETARDTGGYGSTGNK